MNIDFFVMVSSRTLYRVEIFEAWFYSSAPSKMYTVSGLG